MEFERLNMSETLAKIEKDAAQRQQLVAKIKSLQSELDALYPGYSIELKESAPESEVVGINIHIAFLNMTQSEKVKYILTSAQGAMDLRAIQRSFERRGAQISIPSLMSILSTGKKEGLFENVERGFWM